MQKDNPSIDWLEPWHPMLSSEMQAGAEKELASETCEKHVLYRLPVRALGYRQDCDDVLFQLLDDTGRVAIVHLTYAQHPETDPLYPSTEIFDSLSSFIESEMIPEHQSWVA